MCEDRHELELDLVLTRARDHSQRTRSNVLLRLEFHGRSSRSKLNGEIIGVVQMRYISGGMAW